VINYGRQFIDSADIKAVGKVLKSDWLTQGPQVISFEKKLKSFFGAKHCCVVANGTAALHLAGLALGWKPGNIVITSTVSFLATSNCIIYNGAIPEFIDIDNSNYNIDLFKLEKKIKTLKKAKKKIVAIIATDFAGYPCDWQKLKKIALKYKLDLINDNCHAIGSSINRNKKYAVKFADVVTHSYHPVKSITTGEGGAILSNNKKIIEKVKMLRSHGVIRKSHYNPWYYEMHELGFNYRISDIQCSLGISQLRKISKFVRRRQKIAKIYDKAFINDDRFIVPKIENKYKHSYHLYPLQINFDKLKISKKTFFKKMKKKNINLQVHYIPIHLQPYYRKKYGLKKGRFPIAEQFYKREVSLPIYFSLKEKEIFKVIRNIKSFCKNK
jgi:UDP-4-amino-4,6-dideoxy-N-acetyl-beta-L-altrosamine transaminase